MSDLLRVLAVLLLVAANAFFVIGEAGGEGVRSAAELQALVDEAEVSGVIPRAQEELLHNVFDFAGREAGDVMVPAPDVAWLDVDLLPDDRTITMGSRIPL